MEEYKTVAIDEVKEWFKAAKVNNFPPDGGACIRYKGKQIAVFNFVHRNKWYACQNLCPHKMQMILSRGIIGSTSLNNPGMPGGQPKVACPYHKKTFSLETGENLNGEETPIATYPVKIEDGYVYVGFRE